MITAFSIFILLHGLVHLLYFGQSQQYFELQPGMTWPNQSWILSNFFEERSIKLICSTFCAIDALVFVGGAVVLFFKLSWSEYVIILGCILTSMTYLLFWDGQLKRIDNQGGIGVLISMGIILLVFFFKEQ
jgi:hypothetical protein